MKRRQISQLRFLQTLSMKALTKLAKTYMCSMCLRKKGHLEYKQKHRLLSMLLSDKVVDITGNNMKAI